MPMTVYVLIMNACTGYMPPQGMTGCRDVVGAMLRPFESASTCQVEAELPPRLGRARCVEMRIPREVFEAWKD